VDKEARVAELEGRAHDVQMLKFGQEVDLELLDALGSTNGAEEALRAELARQEAAHAAELAAWDAKIAARTDELVRLHTSECHGQASSAWLIRFMGSLRVS
jgi:hypothetical protein